MITDHQLREWLKKKFITTSALYLNVTRQKISFQVAAPKVNNTMANLIDRSAFWIMVTFCIGRVALLKKLYIVTVLEMKQSSACFNEL